ncbi:endolytic transglycosylase MltG [Nocardioides rubriscoriae]|uniref:endolytic transglycosylase MltG n=1 Tax=Nocardioides rubriscoriae TaxID=642762 RepID=UPI0011DF91D9|nr:endolytic transglycosylase MltG [Nocardioides rubriscoriae]
MSDHEPYGVDHGIHDDASIVPGHGPADAHSHTRRGGSRRGRRRSGCLPVLVVLAVLVVGAVLAVRTVDVSNPFASDAADFAGPGSGSVVFTVAGGDSISVMARNLEALGVVASAEAYVEAADADDASRGIREGVYRLKKKMKAAQVVDVLVGGRTRGTSFTFTPGKTVEEVLALLVKDTGITRKQYDAVLADPQELGLPPEADGSAEGYLSPGSFVFFPDDDAATILSTMVARTVETLDEVDLAGAADRLGYSEHDLMTIASLVEAEGSLLDETGKAKIARVVYNRLADPTAETIGRLQMDATINYARGEKVAVPSQAQIDEVATSPYNTYTMAGLPPGPIATPSRDAIQAAIKPVKGPWFYYVTVDLDSGKTKFATTYDDFLALKAELRDYCATKSDRC